MVEEYNTDVPPLFGLFFAGESTMEFLLVVGLMGLLFLLAPYEVKMMLTVGLIGAFKHPRRTTSKRRE